MLAIEYLAHKFTAAVAGKVQRNTEKYNGYCVANFSQAKGQVLSSIMENRDTFGGICEALSVSWIKYHADDDSMWNHVFVSGDSRNINLNEINKIKMLQQFNMNAENQDDLSEKWLISKGIMPIQVSMVGSEGFTRGSNERFLNGVHGRKIRKNKRGETHTNPIELARAIARTSSAAGEYKKIGVHGKFAHAMAAYSGGEGVVFFDPNFGEFAFENANDFVNWFANHFWSKSHYGFGLGGGWELRHYSSKMGRVANRQIRPRLRTGTFIR